MKYKAIVLDDDDQVRRLIVEQLRSRDFDVQGYGDAESLLAEVFDAGLPIQELPDLVVVDLQLTPTRMQGLRLLNELAERDAPCEIILISGSMTNVDVDEALESGWGAWLSKPFGTKYGLQKMERLAETGRKRRLYRASEGPQAEDPSRLERPVFLSYSDHNRKLATALRRVLEADSIPVWYAPDMLWPGTVWRPRVQAAIDQARIFLPLITDSYADSAPCLGEIDRFWRRLEDDRTSQLLMLPVVSRLSADKRNNNGLQPIFEKYHCLDISSQFVVRLTRLSSQIQSFLEQERPAAREVKMPPRSGNSATSPEKIA
jgi:CheY-like chemotaxis protein